MKTIPYLIIFFSAGWIANDSVKHYYDHHISAINIETGEQKEIIFKEDE